MQAPHLHLDLVERDVERNDVIGAGALSLHQVLVEVHEDLARVRVGGALRRELVVLDIDAAHIAGVLVDPLELLERDRT